jgi:hypothetical protein
VGFKRLALFFVLLISLCAGCGERLPEVPPPDRERTFATPTNSDIAVAPTVGYCQLAEHPAAYNRRLVRIGGRLRRAFEESTFFSPSCPNHRMYFYLDQDAGRFSEGEAVARIGGPEPEYGSVERDIVVVDEFEDGAIEQQNYGHLGGYEMRLIVFRVEK